MRALTCVILPAAAVVASCATTSTEHLDERTMVITGQSGPLGSGSQVMRKMVITAAQEAQRRGYSHFEFLPPHPGAPAGQAMVRFLNSEEGSDNRDQVWSVAEVLEATRVLSN